MLCALGFLIRRFGRISLLSFLSLSSLVVVAVGVLSGGVGELVVVVVVAAVVVGVVLLLVFVVVVLFFSPPVCPPPFCSFGVSLVVENGFVSLWGHCCGLAVVCVTGKIRIQEC